MPARIAGPIDPDAVLFRTLSSLSEAQAGLLEAALPGLAGSWCLERHESCEGNLLLLLMPVGGDDTMVSFTVDQDAAGLNLGVLRGDEPVSRSRHGTMEALIPVLRRLAALEASPVRDGACAGTAPDDAAADPAGAPIDG